jgi:hypothetical protein
MILFWDWPCLIAAVDLTLVIVVWALSRREWC